MDRDDVTSAGLTAIGIVAGTVARAVALGGRLVAAGLETIENALRDADESSNPQTRSRPSPSTARSFADSDDDDSDEDGAEGFARLPEPAFEPADGATPPRRPARSAIRRSSAGAAARTAPGPRPAKRATAKSLPPNLRPVEPGESAPEPVPVKGAAGAADVDAVTPAKAAKATAKKGTAKKTTAKRTAKTTAKKTTAKKTTAKTTANQTPAEQGPAEQGPAEQGPAEQGPAEQGPAEQAPATDSAESASTGPDGSSDAGEASVQEP